MIMTRVCTGLHQTHDHDSHDRGQHQRAAATERHRRELL